MKKHIFCLWSAFYMALVSISVQADYDYGDPTPEEQAHLEAINRARAAPFTEAARLGIDLFEGVQAGDISGEPAQPLVSHALLLAMARQHSRDMLDRGYFAHVTPEGLTSGNRAENIGYPFRVLGENIASSATTAILDLTETSLYLHDILFIDEDYPGRGHRVNILSPRFKEIGVGLEEGILINNNRQFNAGMVTTNFGTRLDEQTFITGVVFDDFNRDGLYTAGEGLAGVSLTIEETGDAVMSANAGGYAIPLAAGDYTLIAEDSRMGSARFTFSLGTENKKLDILATDFGSDNTGNTPYPRYNGSTGVVTLPVVQVFDVNGRAEFYQAEMALVETVPTLRFKVTRLTPLSSSTGEAVPRYLPESQALQIPQVGVDEGAGEVMYRAELRLSAIENEVIFFDLFNAFVLE